MACGFEPHHRQSETCVTAQVFLYVSGNIPVSENIRMICFRDRKVYLIGRHIGAAGISRNPFSDNMFQRPEGRRRAAYGAYTGGQTDSLIWRVQTYEFMDQKLEQQKQQSYGQ